MNERHGSLGCDAVRLQGPPAWRTKKDGAWQLRYDAGTGAGAPNATDGCAEAQARLCPYGLLALQVCVSGPLCAFTPLSNGFLPGATCMLAGARTVQTASTRTRTARPRVQDCHQRSTCLQERCWRLVAGAEAGGASHAGNARGRLDGRGVLCAVARGGRLCGRAGLAVAQLPAAAPVRSLLALHCGS